MNFPLKWVFTGRLDTPLAKALREVYVCYPGMGGGSPIHELYGYVPNYAPFVVSSLSQAKEEHSHLDNCCLEQGRKFSLLGKSLECQRLGTLPPQSTTRCATTQRHAGYCRQENIYMYPEGHHSHITTKSVFETGAKFLKACSTLGSKYMKCPLLFIPRVYCSSPLQ